MGITFMKELDDRVMIKYFNNSKIQFEEKRKKPVSDNAHLNDFDRLRTIGTGTFGRVLLVRHRRSEKYFAMKILNKKKMVKLKQVQHVINEKEILRCTESPFFVQMQYHFKDNSNLYMVMEYIPGGEFFSYLRRNEKLNEFQAQFYAAQIVLAIEYLHKLSIVFRDLKPENLLINKDGYLKLTDFGFAKIIRKKTWTLCGTPEYLAPEMVLSKGYDKSVDWWALGILIYEMVAGYPPYFGDQPIEIYKKIVTGRIKFLSSFSPELKDFLRSLLQTDPQKRYGNEQKITDMKDHDWFCYINWSAIFQKKIDAPYIPCWNGPMDSSNYENCEEQVLKISKSIKYADEFADF